MNFKLGKYTYTILMFRSETPRPKLDVGTRVIFSRDKNPKNGLFATIEKNEGYPYKYEILTHGGGTYYASANEVYVDKKLLKQWPESPQRMSTRLIGLHKEAGRVVGEKKTCGKKMAYIDFDKAYIAAVNHNKWKERKHDVEPYPCPFCEKWHIGGIMPEELLLEIVNKDGEK